MVNALILPRVVSHLAHVLLKKKLVLGGLSLLLLPLLKDLIELRGKKGVRPLEAHTMQLRLVFLLVLADGALALGVSLLLVAPLQDASRDQNVVVDPSLVRGVLHQQEPIEIILILPLVHLRCR